VRLADNQCTSTSDAEEVFRRIVQKNCFRSTVQEELLKKKRFRRRGSKEAAC